MTIEEKYQDGFDSLIGRDWNAYQSAPYDLG